MTQALNAKFGGSPFGPAGEDQKIFLEKTKKKDKQTKSKHLYRSLIFIYLF